MIFEKIKKYRLIILISLIFAGIAVYAGYQKSSDQNEDATKPEITSVKKSDISFSVSGSGQIYAKSQVDIKPQVAGDGLDILKVTVKNDQEVKKGDLIAVLDYNDAQKSVRNAELDLESAKLKYESTKDDYEDDKASSYDKKIQKLTVAQRTNNLADAKEKLSDYFIKAPFDGIVTGLNVEAGSSISRNDVLASVITTQMYAKISLNEVDAVSVEVGDQVKLTLDAIDGFEILGKVFKKDTIGKVEQGVVYYEAEISFENSDPRLNPGMSVSAEILTESKKDVLVIPASAVKSGPFGEYVQVIDEGNGDQSQDIYYLEKNITTGLSDGINVEVVNGLKDGERIIVKSVSAKSDLQSSKTQSQGLLNSAVRIPGSGMGR